MSIVLVTGGSGFVASHIILQLLAAGHRVRTTVRTLKRESEVRTMLEAGGADIAGAAESPTEGAVGTVAGGGADGAVGGAEAADRLSFFAANLESDAGWREAVSGCEYVLHVASPFPASAPKHEDELIVPAREGALRVLRASRDAGVKRVVLTSSFAAIGYGHPQRDTPFDETDWTDTSGGDVAAYIKSKTLAERAAWDFIAREGGALELATVNPVGVFGPVLGPDFATSISLVKRLMDGGMPGCPRLYFGAVDVRDVADLHLRAMTDPAAKGERFLAVAGNTLSIADIAKVLKRRLGASAKRVPTRQLPDWVVRLVGTVNPASRQLVPQLGKIRRASNEKAKRVLGWTPRSNEEALVATAESLVRLRLLRDSP